MYNDGYTFIGPYSINTSGVSNDKIKAEIITGDGSSKTTQTFSTSTNKSSIMNFSDGSVNLSNYSSTSLYIAVQGEISGIVKNVKLYRQYKTVQARVVSVLGLYTGSHNFIMFDGCDVDRNIEISLPAPVGVEVKFKKVDSDTGKELTGVRFVIQDTNTKEYLAKTNGGSTKRVTDPGTDYSNVTILANDSSINIDKDGTYRIIEIQPEKISSSDSKTYYEKATTSEPLEIGTITVKNSKVTTSSSNITVSNGTTVTVTLKNKIKYLHIRIYKTDLTTGKTLHNVKFVVKHKDSGQYVKQEKDNDAEYVSDIKNATQFSIPSNKEYVNVSYLTKEGTYEIYEVQRENDAYVYVSLDKPLLMATIKNTKLGNVYEVKLTNEKIYRKVKLIKIDADSKVEVAGMGIVFYDETDKGYFVEGNAESGPSLINDITKATKYKTKVGGINITQLKIGHTYTVYEVESNTENGYKYASYEEPINLGQVKITEDANNTVQELKVSNKRIYTNVKLVKIDEDSKVEIEGIGIVLYDATEKKYFVQGDKGKPSELTDNIKDATLYITKKGGVDVNKLVIGHKYIAYEVKSDPEIGYRYTDYDNPLKVKEFTATLNIQNKRIEITITNKRIYRNMEFIKIDSDTKEEIEGMGIVFYDVTEQKYFVQGETGKPSELTNNIEDATLYITKKGGVDVNKLLIGHTYIAYEVISNPDIGYEFTGYDKPLKLGEFTVVLDKENTRFKITYTNTKIYMNVRIKKVDADNKQKELEGMGIVLYDVENKKYVVEGKPPESEKYVGDGKPCTYVDNIKDATIFYTKKGGVDIKYLARHHSYIVYEVVNPIYGYTEVSLDKPLKIGEFTLSGNDATLEYTAENLKITGNLIIEKKDIDNSDWVLEGISFKIKNSEGKYIIAQDQNKRVQTKVKGKIYLGGLKTTTNVNSATEFITDKNARIEIYNILMDTYTVIETSVGDNFGYDIDDDYVSWETSAGTNGTGVTAIVVVNRQKSQDTEISTANMSNGKYDKLVFKNKRKYIKISGFAWEDIAPGKDNKIDEVWTDGTEDKKLKNITVKIKTSAGSTLATKVTDSDGKYIFGNYDEDKTAIKIKIDDIIGGYIEFEYNGLTYKSVTINSTFTLDQSTGKGKVINGVNNSASDATNRDQFNKRFETISYNTAHDANNGQKHALGYDYDKEKHVSSHKFLGNDIKYGYDGQEQPVSGMADYYLINAVTTQKAQKALCTEYGADDIRKNSVIEIAGVNLGITVREQADLAISSDLAEVTIAIKTGPSIYENTYKYGKRNIDSDENAFEIETKFGNKEGTSYSDRGLNVYTRRIYESDLAYVKYKEDTSLMNIYVTYKIRVKNQSEKLDVKVKELVNYYDERYEIADNNWTGNSKYIQGNSSTTSGYTPGYTPGYIPGYTPGNGSGNTSSNTQENNKIAQGYKTAYTQAIAGKTIEPGGYVDINIKFKLTNEAVEALAEKQTTLNNVSEISAFSTIEGGKTYAAIDLDSNPGSAEIKLIEDAGTTTTLNGRTYEIENKTLDTTTYEDDTDMAPSLILGMEDGKPSRGLSGTVFEDDSINGDETKPNTERIGDGILGNDKHRIVGATVQLLNETAEEVVNLYQLSIENGELKSKEVKAETKTNDKGEYEFLGVVPGRYLIRYTYDSSTYIVDENGNKIKDIDPREYKSTIITSNLIKTALNLNGEVRGKEERMGNLNWILPYEGKRYSDAVDDISKREGTEDIYYGNYEDTSSLVMTADTAYFDVGVEYSDVKDSTASGGFNRKVSFTDYKDEDNDPSDDKIIGFEEVELENGSVMKIIKLIDAFYAVNPYQDFGIIERPRQVFDVNKRVSDLKLILTNGQMLINGNPYKTKVGEEYANWKDIEKPANPALQYVKALPGKISAEIDNELMQGATLSVEYAISIKNDSELDYEGEQYYYYGTGKINLVKSVIKKVADYMENGLVYNDELNEQLGWQKIEADKLKEYEESGVTKQLIADDVYEGIKEGYTIAVTEKFIGDAREGIAPGTAKTIKMYASRLLSTKNDEEGISASNHAEIIETTRKIKDAQPGNYDPSKSSPNEPDDGKTTILITPPTGLTDNRTVIIMLVSIGVVVLAGGIYLIKKKVLV